MEVIAEPYVADIKHMPYSTYYELDCCERVGMLCK